MKLCSKAFSKPPIKDMTVPIDYNADVVEFLVVADPHRCCHNRS